VKFAFIDAEKAYWPVEVQCEVFGVSRSGYYAWKRLSEASRAREDAELVLEIKVASEVGRGNYGSPRVHRQLRAQGCRIPRKADEESLKEVLGQSTPRTSEAARGRCSCTSRG
jgi:putative transposase